MARIRTVKPRLFASPSMARVDIPARYLFIGLFTEADDEGRMFDSPKKIAGNLFPHDDHVTASKVAGWLDQLAVEGSILRYEVDGVRYLQLNFEDHQKISHPVPSILPSPSGEVPEVLRPDREQGTGNREQGLPATQGADAAPLPLKLESPKVNGNGQPRADQVMFQTVAEVCGWPLDGLTPDARGRLNSAAKQLRDVDATEDDIRLFGVLYAEHYPDIDLTPQAITGNWSAFKGGKLYTAARRRR